MMLGRVFDMFYIWEQSLTDCDLQHTEGFKKRWFTMDDRRLMYFKDPLVRRALHALKMLEQSCHMPFLYSVEFWD